MSKETLEKNKPEDYFKGNEWQLPTDIRIVNSAADEFRKRLLVLKWKEEDINWLEATFREALINAITHGNLGIKEKSEDESWQNVALREQAKSKGEKSVYVRLDITSDKIILVVRDEGSGFDWKKQLDSASENTAKTSGRGATYMKMFFDSVSYNEAGNEVILIKGRDRVAELFVELGLDIKEINPNILARLKLLHERTKTFEDELNAIEIARRLFDYYLKNKQYKAFTEEERRIIQIATVFTDIGKTGPANATSEQQKAVADIFNVESKEHGKEDKMTVFQYVEKYFPGDYEKRREELNDMGLKLEPEIRISELTMRQFWNLHAQWTLDIISGDGVPNEAVAAAAVHHLIEGVNPDNLVDKEGKFTKYFSENAYFDRAEKLVIILDKYNAARRRGGQKHQEAMVWVRNLINKNPRFTDDPEFEELLDNLDAMISVDERVYEE